MRRGIICEGYEKAENYGYDDEKQDKYKCRDKHCVWKRAVAEAAEPFPGAEQMLTLLELGAVTHGIVYAADVD